MPADRDNPKLAELIEACRPGSDDLQAGDMSAARERIASDAGAQVYYERVQRSDARLATAFHDVPVPAGLVDRLLAAVDAAAPAPNVAAEVELPARGSSRRWLVKLAIAASVLGLIGSGLVVVNTFSPYSSQQCIAQALQAKAHLPETGWQPLQSANAPAERAPKTRLRSRAKDWRTISFLGDDQAVAYRYANGATLIVSRPNKSVSALPIAPPSTPQQKGATSAATHVAAWTDGGLVHVLIISGPIEEYRRMTDTSRPVIAQLRPQTLRDRYHG